MSLPLELRVISGGHMEMFAPARAAEVGVLLNGVLAQCEAAARLSPDVVTTMNALFLETVGQHDWERLTRLSTVFGTLQVPHTTFSIAHQATAGTSTGLAPRDATEHTIARLFAGLLERDAVPVDADFLALGGTSLMALHLLTDIEHELGVHLPVSTLLRGATVTQLAEAVRAGGQRAEALITLRAEGTRPPFFCAHPAGGSAFSYRYLAEHLGAGQPFYGLECVTGYAGMSIAQMAATYIRAIREVQPRGPYFLGGWSFGGNLAFEMARQLEAAGDTVALVALIDSRPTTHAQQMAYLRHMTADSAALCALIGRHLAILAGRDCPVDYAELRAQPESEREEWFVQRMAAHQVFPASLLDHFVRRFVQDFRLCTAMMLRYPTPTPCHANLLLLRATDVSDPYEGFPALEEPIAQSPDLSYGWATLTRGRMTIRLVPGTHETLPFEPEVTRLAEELGAALVYRARELTAAAEAEQPAFQELSEADWKTLLDHTTAIRFLPGDVLIHQGDVTRSLYIVAEGQLEVVVTTANGARQHIRVVSANSVIGELAFLDGQPRTASVVALAEGSAYRLTMEDFEPLKRTQPALAAAVLLDIAQVVSQRFRLMNRDHQ